MKFGFNYETRYIEFEIVFRNRKTMEISIKPPDEIVVLVPTGTSIEFILERVKDKGDWIVKKLIYFESIGYERIEKKFINGETFLYLGENYPLQIILDSNIKKIEVKLYESKLCVRINEENKTLIKSSIEKWYREKAKTKIEERIKYYQKYFSKSPMAIKVKEQKRRWGSCSSQDVLLFNWRCIMAREDVLDYIIVHEMCHMDHKNHSKEYWKRVESIIPDYKIRQEWLKHNGFKMNL